MRRFIAALVLTTLGWSYTAVAQSSLPRSQLSIASNKRTSIVQPIPLSGSTYRAGSTILGMNVGMGTLGAALTSVSAKLTSPGIGLLETGNDPVNIFRSGRRRMMGQRTIDRGRILLWQFIDRIEYAMTSIRLRILDKICGPEPRTLADRQREFAKERLQRAFPTVDIDHKDQKN